MLLGLAVVSFFVNQKEEDREPHPELLLEIFSAKQRFAFESQKIAEKLMNEKMDHLKVKMISIIIYSGSHPQSCSYLLER